MINLHLIYMAASIIPTVVVGSKNGDSHPNVFSLHGKNRQEQNKLTT